MYTNINTEKKRDRFIISEETVVNVSHGTYTYTRIYLQNMMNNNTYCGLILPIQIRTDI